MTSPVPARARRTAPAPARPRLARRLGACTLLVGVCFALLAGRVTQLQAMSGDRYTSLALGQRLRTEPVAAMRGSIFDRNGRDLAISIERSSIVADPTLVTDPALYASKLAAVLGADQAVLLARLADRERRFVYLARTVDDALADQVAALGLPGVGAVPEPKRHYPAGDLAGALVGRVGGEGHGLDGIESLYDELLTGVPGEIVVEQDQRGRDIPDTVRRQTDAQRGADVVLTIDQALQYEVERSLTDQVEAAAAHGGMAIVLDLATGDVLAMSTVQGATGTEPARPAVAGEKNRPLTDLFEPGSTNKVITVAAAIEHGLVGPQTPFEVPSWYRFGDHTYRDVHPHATERWSTTDILRESSNVGTIKIAEQLGDERLAQALRDFGLGEKTAVDYPGQPAGILLDPDEYYATGLASTSIGYGAAVTAMQMVDVFATVANGGTSKPPRLLEATIRADGTRARAPSEPGRRVVSTETAGAVTAMLTEVVARGTGACAAVPGYTVAGKTGTSRKPLPTGGYGPGTLASFVGFAPAEAPRLAAIVVLDEPDEHYQYGSRAAAPVFAEIMQFGLTRSRVAPSAPGGEPQYDAAQAQVAAEGMDCAVPHGDALTALLEQRRAAAAAPATPEGADTLTDDTDTSE